MTQPIRLSSPRVLFSIVMLALCLIGIRELFAHLAVSKNDSVDAMLLWKSNTPPAKGDFVRFEMDDPFVAAHPIWVTKTVSCMAGETLARIDKVFFCEGRAIAKAKTKTADGRPMPQFRWRGEIPAGKAFITGDHVHSYDSRYYGFVALASLQRLEKIL